jgi:hypothetical protein
MGNALPHQLKERETDLIGAYFLYTSKPPNLQYMGEKLVFQSSFPRMFSPTSAFFGWIPDTAINMIDADKW